jgi:hypothetical protein
LSRFVADPVERRKDIGTGWTDLTGFQLLDGLTETVGTVPCRAGI